MDLSAMSSRITNLEIQKHVARVNGFVGQTGWIEHCKEVAGLIAGGTSPEAAVNPCPPERQEAIIQAFRRLGAL
jgi:hypothetical protein